MMIKSVLLALIVVFISGCSTMELRPDTVAVETVDHGQCLATGKGATLSFEEKRVNFICPDGYVLLGEPYEKAGKTVMDAGRLTRSGGRYALQPSPAVEIRRGLDSRCQLQPDPGPCQKPEKKYYFDRKTKSCRPFLWGGCGGVVPFESMDECEQECYR